VAGLSETVFDPLTLEVIRKISPTTVLDIGAGQGKYAELVRQAAPQAHIRATEISADYVAQFDLRAKYNDVRVMDAYDLIHHHKNETYDMVVIGDCIEHLPKSRGLDLLNFLTYRCGYLLVIAPEFSYYDTAKANLDHHESHISVWSERDFIWHDRWAWMRSEVMQFFLLRGYQTSPMPFDRLVGDINANPPTVTRMGTGAPFKPAHLLASIVSHTEVIDGNSYTYRNF